MWEKVSFVRKELDAFEAYLNDKYESRRGFLNKTSRDVIFSGGKRIRPALVIISGMFGDYDRKKVFPVAAAIETLHTATLIHDDIIDCAKTRRGELTVSEKNGINLAVYTGDYLFAHSMLLLAESGLPSDKLSYVARAAKQICTGEVNQYLSKCRLTSVTGYLKRVMKKTGVLFAASCSLGAYVTGCNENIVKMLAKTGMNIGIAFQIRDDILDISSSEKKEGKPVANDLKEGIVTLPFIFAAERSERIKLRIFNFFEGNGEIKSLIRDAVDAGGLEEAMALKARYLDRCMPYINALPKGRANQAMRELLACI
jgi:heptaprenyl diphosphate synthase